MKATAGIPGRKTTTAQSTPTWQAGIVAKAIRGPIAPRSKKMPNKGDSNGPADGETPESAAHYIAALAGELAKIARRNGLDTLSEILEMARLEADQTTKQ